MYLFSYISFYLKFRLFFLIICQDDIIYQCNYYFELINEKRRLLFWKRKIKTNNDESQ